MSFNKNKFGSKKKKDKKKYDGHIFDSDPEFYRYIELKVRLKKGLIESLDVHPNIIIEKASVNESGQKISKWSYTADFIYLENGIKCIEDVKSLRITIKNGKKTKYGTATLRDYKLTRNAVMRKYPECKFVETYY